MVVLFGVDIPLLEILATLSIVVVIYLIILEFEFRQLRNITRKFDEEEVQLGVEMRELREEISKLRSVIAELGMGKKTDKKA
ncbi:MAG: hypothetical protein ABIH52_02815 [Candidatus Aenigmatarchaeota archaeon]